MKSAYINEKEWTTLNKYKTIEYYSDGKQNTKNRTQAKTIQ